MPKSTRTRPRWSLPLAIVSVLFLVRGSAAHAADGFESVRCDSNIPRALMGKRLSNEPVETTEKRHVALQLKTIGGDEITDDLNTISWSICGKEFVLLQDAGDVVRDVITFPPHSQATPEFVGGDCQMHGARVAATVMAVLQSPAAKSSISGEALIPVTTAWKIDERRRMFVALPTDGLSCPSSGIVTADGGK